MINVEDQGRLNIGLFPHLTTSRRVVTEALTHRFGLRTLHIDSIWTRY